MTAPRISGLYAITDPVLLPCWRLPDGVSAALQGGVRWVQYRNKRASAEEREQEARVLQLLCGRAGARLIINDDVELAARIGAAGVHVGQSDAAVRAARARLGPGAIIGATCHADVGAARRALSDGADYVAFGRFHSSATKPDAPPCPLHVLRAARAALAAPIVAIGGITPENAPPLLEAGADALAVIHGLFAAPDIAARAARYLTLFPGPARDPAIPN
jgi:thiamine-phosphate pyrophosphorylase